MSNLVLCVTSGAMLFALPRLCVLDVSCNPRLTQDGGGFTELVSSLSHASSLCTLRLQACGLTADGLDALGKTSSVHCVVLLVVFFHLLPPPVTVLQVFRSAASPLCDSWTCPVTEASPEDWTASRHTWLTSHTWRASTSTSAASHTPTWRP